MRELKLRYVINVVSDIAAKAGGDAQAMDKAQARIQKALEGTTTKMGRFEQVLARIGGVHNASLQRQAQYWTNIAQSAWRAQEAAERYGKALGAAQRLGTGAVMGTMAAGYVVKTALDKPIDYDTRLRRAAGTSYEGQDTAGLKVELLRLEAMVNKTVRATPGASREGTLDAYEKLVGTGAFSKAEAGQLLPVVMKTAVASGADSTDLVQAAEKMKVNFDLKPEEIALALSKVMRGGKEGGFEIKDAAKWIGPLAPLFKGYKGMAGVEAMVTMLQQVRSTAGSNDEAANNLRNFVQKMPADSTRKEFAKQGIDLDAERAEGAVRGESPIDVYMRLLEKVMAKQDPEGKARKAMLAADESLSPEDKAQRYEDVKRIYEGAGLSKIIADLQEMGGYTGLTGSKDYGKKVLTAVQSEDGSIVESRYQFMAEGLGAKSTAAGAVKDKAMSDAMHSVEGPLGQMLDGATGLAQEFPRVAAAAATATVALGAMAAAAVAASVAGGGGAVGKLSGWLGGAAGSLGALFGAGKVAAAGGGAVLAAAAPAATAAAGIFAAYELLRLGGALNTLREAKTRQGVTQTPDAQDRVLAQRLGAKEGGLAENWQGKGFVDPRRLDIVSLTAPGEAPGQLKAGQAPELKVGEGTLNLNVRVTDDRVMVTPSVAQPLSLIRINPGNTNPGSAKP